MGRRKDLKNYIVEPSRWFHVSGRFTVYTLSCPLSKEVMYVGVTRQPLKNRLSGHLSGGNGYMSNITTWIKGLNQIPIIEPIIEFYANNHHEAILEENFWLEQLRQWGFDLLNRKDKSGRYVLHTSHQYGHENLRRIKLKRKRVTQ